MIVRYGDQEVACLVRQTAAVTGRIRIHIYPNGEVEIEAPGDKETGQIRAAAQRRARWIFQHRNAAIAARQMALPREYVSGETHFYLGRRYKLIVNESSARPSEVKLLRGRLVVTLPVADRAAVRRRLNAWFEVRASEYLRNRLSEISRRLSWLDATPPVRLMRMRTQWGSCSPTGVIHLNPALIRAPRHCIDYVIVHELCHLVEHNHSTLLFELLTRVLPKWQDSKKEQDSLAELVLAGD